MSSSSLAPIRADNWTAEDAPPTPPPIDRQLERKRRETAKTRLGRAVAQFGCMLCCVPLFLILGATMLVVGLLNRGRCSREERLPYILIGELIHSTITGLDKKSSRSHYSQFTALCTWC